MAMFSCWQRLSVLRMRTQHILRRYLGAEMGRLLNQPRDEEASPHHRDADITCHVTVQYPVTVILFCVPAMCSPSRVCCRRSEFLGCMSFAVKHVSKKEISGSFRLLSQACGRTQHVPVTSTCADQTDAMANQSESSVEECVSIEESDIAPTPDPVPDRRLHTKKDGEKTSNEDSIFLRHLELDPPVENNPVKGNAPSGGVSKGGRTPFTTTKRLTRQSGTSFGFSIAWTHPPRIERVESGLPADQAGLRPGDYVIFVDKTNVVTLPEEDILKLIKSCGNHLILEVYRKVSANGTIGRSSLLSAIGLPHTTARSSTACSGATTATASIELTKRRLHLPQVTFTSEVGSGIIV
ncbi:hypothetical protein J6590_013065 [Homalodisca vitripennis]|nr:hypothetical protein J6590_013065 [Homalodisca vitripennis]